MIHFFNAVRPNDLLNQLEVFCLYDEIRLFKVEHPVHNYCLVTNTWHSKKYKHQFMVADINLDIATIMFNNCSLFYDYTDLLETDDTDLYYRAITANNAIFEGGKWVGITIDREHVQYEDPEAPIKGYYSIEVEEIDIINDSKDNFMESFFRNNTNKRKDKKTTKGALV